MKAINNDPSSDSENSEYFSNLSAINTDDVLTKDVNISDTKKENT